MTYRTIPDSDVWHIWRGPSGEVSIPPTFYADAGTPIDEETGEDMEYVRTEVRGSEYDDAVLVLLRTVSENGDDDDDEILPRNAPRWAWKIIDETLLTAACSSAAREAMDSTTKFRDLSHLSRDDLD